MNPGFRYHVATISAIFFALAVGIVVGSSFVQSAIVDRQTRRLDELSHQFNQEVGPLREANRQYSAFMDQIAPVLIGGKLAGIRVALIQTGDYPDTLRSAAGALERAGAKVESETIIAPDFSANAQARSANVLRRLDGHSMLAEGPSGALGLLAEAIGRPGHQGDARALAAENLITTAGDYSRPVSFAVLVGGALATTGSRAVEIDLPLIRALKQEVSTVVAVEPAAAEVSYVEALREAGIPTVDNADTDIGSIALVWALQGPAGDYGIKQTARSGLIPSSAPR
jgi:hypothetical protein